MAADPRTFHARVAAHADASGRLAVPDLGMTEWDIYPFESTSLVMRPLREPVLPEPDRAGTDPATCGACARSAEGVWVHERWRLTVLPSAVPLALMLHTVAHHDLADLPDDLAAELGILTAHLARHVEALPGVARCHVYRWGDGGVHLHVWFFARPEGFAQLRGSCLPMWDDLLPPTPTAETEADAVTVARALTTSFGGRVSAT